MDASSLTSPNRWFGHIRLQLEPEDLDPGADGVALAVHRLGACAAQWLREGGDLALRALAPAAALGSETLGTMDLLVHGPGAGLAAFAGLELGFRRVCALHWPGDEFVQQVLAQHGPQVTWLAATAQVQANFHRVLEAVNPTTCQPLQDLSGWLLPHGEWVLYGMPADQLDAAFENLRGHGFALRAAGVEAERGFLAGSVD